MGSRPLTRTRASAPPERDDIDQRIKERIGDRRYARLVQRLQLATQELETLYVDMPEVFTGIGLTEETRDLLGRFFAALEGDDAASVAPQGPRLRLVPRRTSDATAR